MIVTCPACGGTGLVLDSTDPIGATEAICLVCYGMGEVLHWPEPESTPAEGVIVSRCVRPEFTLDDEEDIHE
jgi:DnaJ-class molecular chaperone